MFDFVFGLVVYRRVFHLTTGYEILLKFGVARLYFVVLTFWQENPKSEDY